MIEVQGSEVQSVTSTAVKKEDTDVLNGPKLWFINASVATWSFVLGYTDKNAR